MTSEPANQSTIPPKYLLHQALTRLGSSVIRENILVVGSSGGASFLGLFLEAVKNNPFHPRLFYLESDPEKVTSFEKQYPNDQQFMAVRRDSVSSEKWLTEEQVRQWAREQSPTTDPSEWLNRLQKEQERFRQLSDAGEGIEFIRKQYGVESFDLVILDGNPFAGAAELALVFGAEYVVLVDAVGLRNLANVKRLMNEPSYRLIEGDTVPVDGYAIFQKAVQHLPVEFFTIVLNGLPFLPQQLEVFQQLSIPWRWHIIEGVAEHVHDTAWSLKNGAEITSDYHREGRSSDGTSEWIDEMVARYPQQILVYRQPLGTFWQGKLAMVRAPQANLREECLLWQIDADEFWTPQQIEVVQTLFQNDARRTAAYYFCDFYVGPELVSITPHSYANNLNQDWLRTWRYRPGMEWVAHEPPTLVERLPNGAVVDLGQSFPFTHYETAREGLIFRHLAYVREEQISFKEKYYGYKDALASWKRLQEHDQFPVALGDFFPWAKGRTMVDRRSQSTLSGFFREERRSALEAVRDPQRAAQQRRIVIDGVFYQFNAESGIARVWTCLLKEWARTPFGDRLVVIDREYSAPRIPGITYVPLQAHNYGNLMQDQRRLEAVCRFYEASLFISTYYSRPLSTPSLMMAYDFIPEIFLRESLSSDPMWAEKVEAVKRAYAFICISQNTQQDLFGLYPKTQLQPVRFFHLASDYFRQSAAQQSEFRWKYKLHRPFWLLVGARRSYKNADLFFAALQQLNHRWGFDVVCTGSRDLEVFEEPEINIRRLRLNDHELQCAYSAAEALVYPSLYEGFGLPILEAMKCGCPVITCRISSIPEVAGEAALYVDPKDPAELVQALSRVEVRTEREKLVAAGYQQAAKFSWATAADQTQEFIEAVMESVPRSVDVPSEALLMHPHLLRGLATLDQMLHRGPSNPRVARNLIDRLAAEFGWIPRLLYYESLVPPPSTSGD